MTKDTRISEYIHPLIPDYSAIYQAERYFFEHPEGTYELDNGGEIGKGIFFQFIPESDIDESKSEFQIPFKRGLFEVSVLSDKDVNDPRELLEEDSARQILIVKNISKLNDSEGRFVYNFYLTVISDDQIEDGKVVTKLDIKFNDILGVISILGVAF